MNPRPKPEILAVVGPTATGKTVIGARLAQLLESEVISVDSQQVYEGLSIGVARPTPDEMLGVVHHMIGVVPPTTDFSAGSYTDLAEPILHRMLKEGKVPVLVGGTGFYLRALLQPQHLPVAPVPHEYREQLKERFNEEGPEALYQTLLRIDPERAASLHPNDAVRVIRALEIIHQTGQPVPKTPFSPAYPTLAIGLTYADREMHVRMIRARLEEMVKAGFLDEVQDLYERFGNCPAMQRAHGYPEFLEVLLGKRTLEDALAQVEINIRQYSKRQMTWFRKFPGIQWYCVDVQSPAEIVSNVMHLYSDS